MNNRIKKITVILLIITMTAMLSACGGNKEGGNGSSENTAASEQKDGKAPGTVIDENKKTITFIDQANREVTVPKNLKSTAFCYRVVARFIISLGKGDTIKGMGKREPFLDLVQPSLKNAKDVGKGVVDIEALAELSPDLFIHKANDLETLEAVEKLGIPAVGVAVETPDEMKVALDVLGKALGAQKKASLLRKYYEKKLKKDRKLTASLKTKKTAVVMGSSIGKVADGSMLQGLMIKEAGGTNPAEELDATELWPTVGTEQIFKWNPEFIFISGSETASYSEKDILKDKTWSEVTAVKKRNVFTMPADEDSWEFPGPVSVLGIDYMMYKMYPEIMSKKQLRKEINRFYRISYGRTFTDEELGLHLD